MCGGYIRIDVAVRRLFGDVRDKLSDVDCCSTERQASYRGVSQLTCASGVRTFGLYLPYLIGDHTGCSMGFG